MSVSYYDGPGRGRKQCPTCQKYLHVRNHICDCGYNFQSNGVIVAKVPTQPKSVTPTKLNQAIKRLDGPGKGRKECPNCQKHVGAIVKICFCGHAFVKPDNTQPLDPATIEARQFAAAFGLTGVMYHTVTGKCPVNPLKYSSIGDWAEDLNAGYPPLGGFYSPLCLRYFLTSAIGAEHPQRDTLLNQLNAWITNSTKHIQLKLAEEVNVES
jgi:hypothetical protein